MADNAQRFAGYPQIHVRIAADGQSPAGQASRIASRPAKISSPMA